MDSPALAGDEGAAVSRQTRRVKAIELRPTLRVDDLEPPSWKGRTEGLSAFLSEPANGVKNVSRPASVSQGDLR